MTVQKNSSAGGIGTAPGARARGVDASATDKAAGGRLRICFPFVDRARSVGGSHISAGTLIENIDRSRFDPTVLLIGQPGAVAEYFQARGVPVDWMPGGAIDTGSPLGMMAGIARARRYLAQGGFDVVHTNEGAMHVLWGLAARLAGVAQVWHHRGNPKARGVSLLAPLTATRVITVSSYAAPQPGLYSAAGRSTVVHSPFDLSLADLNRDEARAAAVAELGVPDETSLLGYFGHYSERKRPVLFIEAFARLVEACPHRPILGLMFGEEHDQGMLARMNAAIARHGLQGRILLMGFRKPVAPWIAACDATLVTAVEEPFGRTLIEAMLLGTPVIAAASGGNLEAIEHGKTGLIAAADDADALGHAAARVIENDELARSIARKAKVDALAKFGVQTHVDAVQALYRELERERSRR